MKCKWCDDEAIRKQGRIWLCKKHYRFQQMRVTAKRQGKSVPEYGELERLWQESGGTCKVCNRKLNWLSSEGTCTVITLQHDRQGGTRLLCLSCNTRHASFDGDSFYDANSERRVCPSCRRSLPWDSYTTDNSSRWKNKNTYCKECRNTKHAEWVKRNREKYNEKRREYYHKRIANGCPIPR